MSKSKGNVVDPDQLISQYGADTVRLFSLFAAPPDRDLEWNAQGVEGASRFLNRVFRFINEFVNHSPLGGADTQVKTEASKQLHRKTHQTIKKVTDDIETDFHFNTAISATMELFNLLSADSGADTPLVDRATREEALRTLLILLYPMVPHFSAEMWSLLGFSGELDSAIWPDYDSEAAHEELVTVVLQVNGKVRSRLQVAADTGGSTLEELAFEDPKVQRFVQDKTVKKVIVVQKKLVNIVV
jgi:leucyl-tRNA synthetase